MDVRRVVTGRSEAGKSVFVSDGGPPVASKFQHVPGMAVTLAWETPLDTRLPSAGKDPTPASTSRVPAPGGTTLLYVTFPPDSVRMTKDFDRAAAAAESLRLLPGLAETFEPSAPGMHTTDTVDYGVLLEGELTLDLDDGVARDLKVHDVVVQNGTRHAWRNKSSGPATMLFVLIGAKNG